MSSMDASSIRYNSSHSTDRVQARAGDSRASSGIDVAFTTTQRVLAIASPHELHGDSWPSSPTGTSSFCCNQQYSVTAITTSTGTIAERYAYTAYGQPTILDASGTVLPTSNFSLRYSFTGREWDATLGLYHFRARCMSPMTGRFLSRDPIGYADGFSLYSAMFAFQQMDPTGHVSVAKCGASDTVPYIDPVDMVNGEPVVDNKEVIGSITARGWVELGSGFSFPPKKCGDFVVQLDAHHTKKFNPLNAMEVQQQDSTTSTCSHSSSATEKSIHAEWRCPIACKNFKCESYTFASIFFLTQGKGLSQARAYLLYASRANDRHRGNRRFHWQLLYFWMCC
jgi:RHS repeat-associated protein